MGRIEGMMDQVDRVIYDLKNNPFGRSIMTNIYVHQEFVSKINSANAILQVFPGQKSEAAQIL